MKKILFFCLLTFLLSAVGCGAAQQSAAPAQQASNTQTAPPALKTKVLFVNTSRDPNDNTHKMGEAFLAGVPHDTLFLNDYKIYQLGQHYDDDQLAAVLAAMEQADTIVIGTPVYWHTMSGALKTFIDRLYELDKPVRALAGKKLYFLMQGAAPSAETKAQLPFIMSRVAAQYGMEYMGAATDPDDLPELQNVLHNNL